MDLVLRDFGGVHRKIRILVGAYSRVRDRRLAQHTHARSSVGDRPTDMHLHRGKTDVSQLKTEQLTHPHSGGGKDDRRVRDLRVDHLRVGDHRSDVILRRGERLGAHGLGPRRVTRRIVLKLPVLAGAVERLSEDRCLAPHRCCGLPGVAHGPIQGLDVIPRELRERDVAEPPAIGELGGADRVAGRSGRHNRLRSELDDAGFNVGDVLVERGGDGPGGGSRTPVPTVVIGDAQLGKRCFGVVAAAAHPAGDPATAARDGITADLDVHPPDAGAELDHAAGALGARTRRLPAPTGGGCSIGHRKGLRHVTHPPSPPARQLPADLTAPRPAAGREDRGKRHSSFASSRVEIR
jgi:hypothetical protein